MPDLTKTLKDAVYVSVGLGVLAFQKAQVQRRELRQQVTKQLTGTRVQVQKVARDLESRIEPVVSQLEERLPTQARDQVKQARETAKDARTQLRSLVGSAA